MKAQSPIDVGNHWAAAGFVINGRESFRQFTAEVLQQVTSQVELDPFLVLEAPIHDIGTAKAIYNKEDTTSTFFPAAKLNDGTSEVVTIIVDSVSEWEGGMEAEIRAKISGCSFTFFATDYVLNRDRYREGEVLSVRLGGFCYRVDCVLDTISIETPMGPFPFGPGASVLMPVQPKNDGTVSAETVVQGRVQSSASSDDGRFLGFNVSLPPFAPGAETGIFLKLYAEVAVVSCPSPKAGETLFATLWLQGAIAQ